MDRNQIRVFEDHKLNHDEDDDDAEEALSLSDLPLIQSTRIHDDDNGEDDDNDLRPPIEEEFDFCSLYSKQSQMCSADDVFFQGQILPLRHSLSCENGSGLGYNPNRSVSRSESLDRFYSGRLMIASRSSSSASSSNNSNPPVHKFKPRFNQFHSHPSPSPRIRFPGNKSGSIPSGRRSFGNGSSSIWNVFKLGLVSAPPEIAFHDLKPRCPRNSKSGSRNSSSSTGSSVSITSSRRKRRSRTAALFGAGGCRCSSSDAVPAVTSRVVTIKRSAGEGENRREPERTGGTRSQNHHYYRTFEWIKQLSLENETAS